MTRLYGIKKEGRIAINDSHRILAEYKNKTAPHIGKRPGDAFLKWLLQNNSTSRCEQVPLVEHAERGFESFPDDPRLKQFDPSDQKFVAVVAAHPERPPILQGRDSKWLDWKTALRDNGIEVDFLCREDIQRFDDKKKGRTPEKC